jgi:hypothetical protein
MSSTWNGPAAYRGMAREQADPGAHVGTVQGETAYVAHPNTDEYGVPHPGYVLLTKGDIQITVLGYYSERELLLIADSLK